jgi:hypothetical protein
MRLPSAQRGCTFPLVTMKGFCSLLVQLVALGIPVALCVGMMMGTEHALDWRPPWPMMAGITCSAGVIGFGLWWLLSAQKRETRTTGKISDDVFGEVHQKPSCWEAEVVFPPTGERITVSSFDGSTPTGSQRTMFRRIAERWDDKFRQIENALDAYGDGMVPKRPRRLKFSGVGLASDADEWSLDFDVAGSKARWGFSADFRGDTLQTLEDLH